MLKGYKKNDKRVLKWTTQTENAFDTTKKQLANAALLVHPDPALELSLMTDASDFAMGAVLQQKRGNILEPIAFFSKRLSNTQQKYSAYDRELLACYSGIKYFRPLLEGRNFTLYTDHKPLVYAFMQDSDKATPRQFRHLDFISQFTTDIRHVAGHLNIPADTLSRIEVISKVIDFDYDKLAASQLQDSEIRQLVTSDKTRYYLKWIKTPLADAEILCDLSSLSPRPVITREFRQLSQSRTPRYQSFNPCDQTTI